LRFGKGFRQKGVQSFLRWRTSGRRLWTIPQLRQNLQKMGGFKATRKEFSRFLTEIGLVICFVCKKRLIMAGSVGKVAEINKFCHGLANLNTRLKFAARKWLRPLA
jgi:hypothetical protein